MLLCHQREYGMIDLLTISRERGGKWILAAQVYHSQPSGSNCFEPCDPHIFKECVSKFLPLVYSKWMTCRSDEINIAEELSLLSIIADAAWMPWQVSRYMQWMDAFWKEMEAFCIAFRIRRSSIHDFEYLYGMCDIWCEMGLVGKAQCVIQDHCAKLPKDMFTKHLYSES